MILVNQLYIYPVKSLKGIEINQCNALNSGFESDRIFMITEPNGTFITAREQPALLQLSTKLNHNGVMITLPSEQSIDANFEDFSSTLETTNVWGNHFSAHIASIKVNRFLSAFLEKEVQLRWIGPKLTRRLKHYPTIPLSCADGYPYSLLNLASFKYLQQQCPEKLNIKQFRGNIIINSPLPFAEDGWKTIKIGEVIFDVVKPCSRCVITTIDNETNKPLTNHEPLKTLGYFRRDERGEIDFGINMIARNHGIIAVNDKVEILERHIAKNYIKTFPREETIPENTCFIHVNDQTIIKGNNKQPIIEQLEQHNVLVSNSCRSGICGRCVVTLDDGDVMPMTQDAIRRNNRILACSCIPKTDIKISLKLTK